MRWTAVLVLTAALLALSCSPTRYETYRIAGNGEAWTITADRALSGTVSLRIDGTPVVAGPAPVFAFTGGANEYSADYQGHAIKILLTHEPGTPEVPLGIRCVATVDGTVAARFSW